MDDIQKLQNQASSVQLPEELRTKIDGMLDRLKRQAEHGSYTSDFDEVSHYLDWVTDLPWYKSTKDILDINHVRQVLDSHHYGLDDLKQRVLEYVSVLILNETKHTDFHAPILLLVGLVGTGKTTLSQSIAEALGRKFIRIPFGGMSSALDLRGQSRAHSDSEPGQIIKSIRRAGVKNPVILMDEIDRIAPSAQGEIMGVLVELLDPEQNATFIDHYIDYPFDLSQALFIATSNNTSNISTAVMDRLEPLMMPSYTDEEKIRIAKDYVLPREIKTAGLAESALRIDDSVWPKIVRPLGFDSGIRTLERTINGIVRKTAKLIIEGKGQEFTVNDSNIKEFLPSN